MKRKEEILEEIKALGFEIAAHEREDENHIKKKIIYKKAVSVTRMTKLLKTLTPEVKIRFYDDDPDTFDTDGGYCQAVVLDKKRVLFRESNHDWCKNWEEMSLEDLAVFLQYNWSVGGEWGKYKNYVVLEENNLYPLMAVLKTA